MSPGCRDLGAQRGIVLDALDDRDPDLELGRLDVGERISSLSQSLSALTAETLTPCRPPETSWPTRYSLAERYPALSLPISSSRWSARDPFEDR
jgi:hypothetical protein